MDEGIVIATLSSIATSIVAGLEWFWGIFTDLMNTITTNPLMLWTVGFAIVAGVVGLAIKVIRRFGVKSRR